MKLQDSSILIILIWHLQNPQIPLASSEKKEKIITMKIVASFAI